MPYRSSFQYLLHSVKDFEGNHLIDLEKCFQGFCDSTHWIVLCETMQILLESLFFVAKQDKQFFLLIVLVKIVLHCTKFAPQVIKLA